MGCCTSAASRWLHTLRDHELGAGFDGGHLHDEGRDHYRDHDDHPHA